MTPLDSRLQAVAEAVRPGSVAADVGTDHGYLICALVASGRCPGGYASDVAAQPLEAARRHILEAGLQDHVKAVLSDGLQGLPGEEIDDVILAGMGGELIARLLTAVSWTRNPDKRFVLQPMTKADRLRWLIYRAGFALEAERAVASGRFVYTVMTVRYTGQPKEIDLFFQNTGLVWEGEDEQSLRYLHRVGLRLQKRADGLIRAGRAGEAEALNGIIARIGERTEILC